MILQTQIPYDPFDAKPMPGTRPLDMGDWLQADDAYTGQMALRRQLLTDRHSDVVFAPASASDMMAELRDVVLGNLPDGFEHDLDENTVTCPDGHIVDLGADPLDVLGQLVQEDFCILQKPDGFDEHILTAAILCFPASWSLSEKADKPLIPDT